MDKQSVNKRLIEQYLSGQDALARLYREYQRRRSPSDEPAEDDLPEVDERVRALAREVGAEIEKRHQRRRYYVPVALAAAVLLAVVAVKVLWAPPTETPEIQLLGAETPEQQVARIRDLVEQGRPDEAAEALAELRRLYPDYPVPADLKSIPAK